MGANVFYDTIDPRTWANRFAGIEALEQAQLALVVRLTAPDPSAASRRVLDLGCGTGRLARMYAADYYVGADRVPQLVGYGTRHTSHGQASFVVADMERLPFRADAFDLLVLMGTLEAEKDVPARLNALMPLLKPGGQLFLTLQNKRNWLARIGNLFGRRYRQTFWSRSEIVSLLGPQWQDVEMSSVFVLPPGVTHTLHRILMLPFARRWLLSAVLRIERLNTERDWGLGYEWQVCLRSYASSPGSQAGQAA